MIIYGQWAEKLVPLLNSRYGSELHEVICIHSHHRIWTAYHSQADATGLLFLALKERFQKPTFVHNGTLCLLCCGYWWKTSKGGYMGYKETHVLMFVPRFNSIKPDQTTGFLYEDINLAYSVFLEELSSGLFSVIGLFVNSDFLSLLAGFSNRTRRTYLVTSTLRTPNTARESLFDHWIPIDIPCNGDPTKPWTGFILNTSCTKKGLFWGRLSCHIGHLCLKD